MGLQKLLDPGRMGREARILEDNLRRRIVGQEEAIRQIVDVYQTFLAGMSTPGRPLGTALFLGPTGSGKTRTVEALAESLLGDARAVLKIDCAEFQHSHEIAKLIGSPPGYLGHRDTHPLLSQELLDQHHTDQVKLSLVLFDEVEKASDALWNLLLGILDKATLTLGDNRRVDFTRAMIFMTSNLGAREMNSLIRPGLGFAGPAGANTNAKLADKLLRAGQEAARRKFTPEFMNRIDKIVVFQPLGEAELRSILSLELDLVQDRVSRAVGGGPVALTLAPEVQDFLLREGTDPRYGARPLKRAVDRLLVHPMSNLIASGQVQGRDRIFVDLEPEQKRLVFFREFEEIAAEMETSAAA